MIIGYARVSTEGQTLEAQLEALAAAGAVRVFREKMSGARGDRPQLHKMIAALEPGDVVLITRLDRLARSTRDLLNILTEIGAKGAAFRSMADPWADTTTPHGRLMTTMIAGFAEFERELILIRTSEGRKRAKARGVKMGVNRHDVLTPVRRPRLTPFDLTINQQYEIFSDRARGLPFDAYWGSKAAPMHTRCSGCARSARGRSAIRAWCARRSRRTDDPTPSGWRSPEPAPRRPCRAVCHAGSRSTARYSAARARR